MREEVFHRLPHCFLSGHPVFEIQLWELDALYSRVTV